MKKEIKVVDEKRGIVQITTIDERFYAIASQNKETGLPEYKFYPAVTYITGFYPKGKFYEAWLKKTGEDAEVLKQLAGEKGSKIHQAITDLIDGKAVSIQSQYINNTTGEPEELTAEEYEAVLSFAEWFKATKPVVKTKEVVDIKTKEVREVKTREVIEVNEELGYAGTIDLICEIKGELWIVDFKSSQSIYPNHELQLSAYKHFPGYENHKIGILQVGYQKNKQKYKFTEIEDKFELFKSVKAIFDNEVGEKTPKQIDLPLELTLSPRLKSGDSYNGI